MADGKTPSEVGNILLGNSCAVTKELLSWDV